MGKSQTLQQRLYRQKNKIRTLIVDCLDADSARDQVRLERAAQQQSPEYQMDMLRRQPLKKLDKANPETRIENTLIFFVDFVKILVKDFKDYIQHQKLTTKALKTFTVRYSAHIKVLKTFDAEVKLNPEKGYNEPLIVKLNNLLKSKLPILADAFNLEEYIEQKEL